jgi:hypothetical protein
MWAMLGEGSNNSKLIVKQNAWYNLKNNQTNEKIYNLFYPEK